jgi:hypothetical protein
LFALKKFPKNAPNSTLVWRGCDFKNGHVEINGCSLALRIAIFEMKHGSCAANDGIVFLKCRKGGKKIPSIGWN